MSPDEKWMKMAIEVARQGIAAGQTPFGACIVRDGKLLACEHNLVWGACDITAHAEIRAIRTACAALRNIDLSGAVIYSTCEPCPMCFSACHWARISKIMFGANIGHAQRAGFHELTISNVRLKEQGGSPVQIVGGLLEPSCAQLFDEWVAIPNRRAY